MAPMSRAVAAWMFGSTLAWIEGANLEYARAHFDVGMIFGLLQTYQGGLAQLQQVLLGLLTLEERIVSQQGNELAHLLGIGRLERPLPKVLQQRWAVGLQTHGLQQREVGVESLRPAGSGATSKTIPERRVFFIVCARSTGVLFSKH